MKCVSTLFIALTCLLASTSSSYTFSAPMRRSTMTMKRGRGSFQKEAGGEGNINNNSMSNVKPMAKSMASIDAPANAGRWVPVKGITSMKELPQEEGVVQLIDTMADALMNKATNPNGAVSVMKYNSDTHCFSSSCSKCKIPLTKATMLPANEQSASAPRLVCDFCKATYNVRTGLPIASEGGAGLFGGVAKAIFSSQDTVPLPIYSLGEKNGKVLINLG